MYCSRILDLSLVSFFPAESQDTAPELSLDSFAQRLFLSPGRQDGIFDQLLVMVLAPLPAV